MTTPIVGYSFAVALLLSGCGSDGGTASGTDAPANPTTTSETTTETTTEAPSTTRGALTGTSPTTINGNNENNGSDQLASAWPHEWREELVGGGQFDAGDYAGQDLVLWFWAPW